MKVDSTVVLIGLALVGCAMLLTGPLTAQSPVTQPDEPCETCETDWADMLISDSNTGYIDNAIVGTNLRLRYDIASDGDRPDRAEFLYGKCVCFTALFGQRGADSPGPADSFDYQEVELTYEYAFRDRFSIFVEVPFRSIDVRVVGSPSGPFGPDVDNSGLGDLRVGVKYALFGRNNRYLTFQAKAYLPTGEAKTGLGTDHASFEPGLLFLAKLSDRLTVAGELRLWLPLDGSPDPVPTLVPLEDGTQGIPSYGDFSGEILRFGVGLGYESGNGSVRVTPVAELVGWSVLDGFATNVTSPGAFEDSGGDLIVNLKLGARVRAGSSGSIYLGYGFALTDDVWYDDVLRLEYRRAL